MFDIVIKNVRIIDGSAAPWYRGDIGIQDGRIRKIGCIAQEENTVDGGDLYVAPGFIDTDMTAVLPEAVRTGMTQGIPAGRAGQPEDVAQAVAFFAAEQSSYLTGQVLCVDGGMAM